MFRLFLKISLFSLLFVFISCDFISGDVDDIHFLLPEKEFTVDSAHFSIDATGDTIPEIDCPANSCTTAGENFSCDTILGKCVATADFELQSELVRLDEEVSELSTINSNDNLTVTFKYIQMEVISNTLNFDLPPVTIYVAPSTINSLYDVNGDIVSEAALIGTLGSIEQGMKLNPEDNIYDIQLSQNGENNLTRYVQQPDVPFYFYIAGQIQFNPGDDIPQGAIKIKVHSAAKASIR
jgi:hypothetical protein